MIAKPVYRSLLVLLLFVPSVVMSALPAVNPSVRYMSIGDSLAAGYKAQPATKGYSYQLYLDQLFGSIPDSVFDNAAVPGATSTDVLNFQIPQVHLFEPTVVTMSVGGNDLLGLLAAPDPVQAAPAVLQQFAGNMSAILANLCYGMPPGGQIYVHTLYTIPEIPGANQVVPLFNQTLVGVVSSVRMLNGCLDKTIGIADVYNAFLGQQGLLLIERYLKRGIEVLEPHPTDKGYRVMESAFRAVIRHQTAARP
jgi:lysophospholipase L1-like esterase